MKFESWDDHMPPWTIWHEPKPIQQPTFMDADACDQFFAAQPLHHAIEVRNAQAEYVGHDLLRRALRCPRAVPDLAVGVYDWVVAWDRRTGHAWLGGRALDILIYLAERPGEVIAKQELIDRVWSDVTVEEGSLRVHVAAIRKKLGDPRWIEITRWTHAIPQYNLGHRDRMRPIDDAERAPDLGQAQVGVVLAQLQAELGPAGEHAVGLAHALGDQVVNQHADVRLAAVQDERRLPLQLQPRVDPRDRRGVDDRAAGREMGESGARGAEHRQDVRLVRLLDPLVGQLTQRVGDDLLASLCGKIVGAGLVVIWLLPFALKRWKR